VITEGEEDMVKGFHGVLREVEIKHGGIIVPVVGDRSPHFIHVLRICESAARHPKLLSHIIPNISSE
jgi:hypothetical protein